MNTYSFAEQAVQELDEICNYVAQSDPKAASRLFEAIRQKCKLLANFPNMGKRYEKLATNLRGLTVEDYIIFYYPRNDGIDIVHIVSGYRDLEFLFAEST